MKVHGQSIGSFAICLLLTATSHTLNAQTSFKMQLEDGVYAIHCVVNGLPLKMIFDTGAANVCISIVEAAFMLKNGYLSVNDIYDKGSFMAANGELVEGIRINLRTIKIGDIVLDNVRATIVTTSTAPLLLGQSALKRLGRFEFDYNANLITIYHQSSGASSPRYVPADTVGIEPAKPVDMERWQGEVLYETALDPSFASLDVYLWKGPDFNSPSLFKISTKHKIQVLARGNPFYKVMINGWVGFVGRNVLIEK